MAPLDVAAHGARWRVVTAVKVASLAEGIQDLKRARAGRAFDADLENDFAASFLRLAELGDDSYSLFFALERLLANVEESPRHTALLFNRAVAWDLLGISGEAARSWREFLAVESESPWSDEARGRLAVVMKLAPQAKARRAAWDPPRLSAAREFVMEELLPTWAETLLGDEPAAAEPILRQAEEIARATGDRLSLASITRLRSAATPEAGRALAAAHHRLAQGIADRRRFATDEAIVALAAAGRHLAALGSPAALLADYHRAMAIYHADQYAEAEILLAEVQATAAARDEPLVSGLSAKARGLIAQTTGRPEAATAFYREALADVERSGDQREWINVASILADGLLAAGRDKEAWRFLHGALSAAWQHPDYQPRYVVSAAGGAMAEKRGLAHLAAAMTRLSLAAIRKAGSPTAIADSATWYAESLVGTGRLAAASAVLRWVRPMLDQLEDPAIRRRARADLDCVAGRQMLAARQAEGALARLRGAADYYESVSLLTHAVPCRAAEGAALLALGDTAAASEVLERSLTLASRLDGFLPRTETFYGASDPTVSLLEATLSLYADQERPWEALRIAALALQRASPHPPNEALWQSDSSLALQDLRTAARRLRGSQRVVLIVYPLPRGLIAWRLDGESLAVHRAAVTQPRVAARVERFLAAIQRSGGTGIDEAQRTALGTLLLGGLLRDVAENTTLVIVSPADLAALPWGFLGVPGSGEPLISKWAIAIAPDLRVALSPPRVSAPAATELLVVANPAIPGDIGTPPLRYAEEEAGLLLRLFPGRASALVGERATKARLLARIGEAASVHLAVHGISDPQTPRASHLVVRGADGRRDALTVDDILALDLRSNRVVVLAACNSSFRSTALATNALGLGEAFLAVGARAVVASGWSVDDAATGRLMATFYRALANGATVAHALRRAQLAELARSPASNPRDFAAFRVLGDPGVTLHSKPRSSAP